MQNKENLNQGSNGSNLELLPLSSQKERCELVKKIIAQTPKEKLTPRYLTFLSDYIFSKKDKDPARKKEILSDNRKKTLNKNETSYEGLVSKFENGEDGIYNLITEDKNIILHPKSPITDADVAAIPALAELRKEIVKIEEKFKRTTNRRKRSKLLKQLIEMRKDQYVIRSAYKKPIYTTNIIKSFSYMSFDDDIIINKRNMPEEVGGNLSLFNPDHIAILLQNYSRLKQDSWDKFNADARYIMMDLDTLIEQALPHDYPMLYDLLIWKIDGIQNKEIQELLEEKYNKSYSIEYISVLWCKKIPKLIAEAAAAAYLDWYYTEKEYGEWKKCSCCGQIKLAHSINFSKNNTSKDGYYSICKRCRKKKRKGVK